ncbi:Beta-lactamase domain-containing protein [Aphelenchoides fujianensis]|nr:Beta-lactamase domain-containing protein [Aphelenchoides fujianensis]
MKRASGFGSWISALWALLSCLLGECWAENSVVPSMNKMATVPPSPWSPSQALKAQSARLMPAESPPVFPPPPIPSANQMAAMTPIVTPASMPPPTPLVHGPQQTPGSPVEFPLLNEAASPPSGQPGPTFTGELQIAHPPTPNEREWVLTTGNESAIDNVLAISLMYGGRLVSMGFFYRGSDIFYYAIMHKYSGPVFLKPKPLHVQRAHESLPNEELDLGLTQLCGQDNGQGKVTFSTYWERIPGVSFRIWFPGTKEAEMQKMILENDGYRLTSLCGYSVRNRAQYVGVWMKPVVSNTPYEAYYGLTLKECLEKDRELRSKGYVAVQFRVFNNANEVLCAAIWDYQPRRWHSIEMGDNLPQIYRNVLKLQTAAAVRTRMPRQISHFIDADQRVTYVVLWSDLHSFRYPNPPEIWANKTKIPTNFLRGTENLLKAEQLDFIVKRVEHFMRDLDIPGLSVAISRDEKLKFAAAFGYGNLRKREQVTPAHQFRVGSVSKPITAAAILLLADQGKIQLDQRVFGPGSIFGNEFQRQKPYGRYVTEITIRNLLEHSCGGWNNLKTRRSTSSRAKTWIYSNFGYQILGHIIERISGMSYEEFVKKNIWDKAGVPDVQVARSTLSEKSKREVLYYMSGNRVGFDPYSMLPPTRTGPWGGWIASPIELLRVMAHLDGFPHKPDLLSDRSLREWVKPTAASNETYGLGWSVNIMGFNGWQHDGRMPGSAAMLVRLDNGLEMAVVVNKEYSERDFFHELGYILHHIGSNCDWWQKPDVDLFQIA